MRRLPVLLIVFVVALLMAACSGDEEVKEVPPTPKLAVVEFATPAPSPTLTQPPAATLTPTPAPTVGMGIAASEPAVLSAAELEQYIARRPADVNPLTGLKMDDPTLLQRRPLMVRVGNDPIARPQVGLIDADIVYEEITEWWVTRFTGIFLSKDPTTIAPVRSARLINLQLVPQYQGALASSGGSDGVRWLLSQSDIVDLDELFVPLPYFYRDNENWATRLAFDATVARQYMADEGLDTAVKLRGFYFTPSIDEKTLPPGVLFDANEVVIPFPQVTSEAAWKYDPASNSYLRFTTGDPHYDLSGKQLSAANVIIYFAEHQATDIVEDSNGATSIRIIMNGRGAAWLLRDGKLLKGNWETDGAQTPQFVFDNGQPMPLKPGNTWVQVIPLDYFVTIDGQEDTSLPELIQPAGTDVAVPTATPPAAPTPTATPIGARPTATSTN